MFETLKETNQIKNLQILLIEEDHFLVPDAIFMLRKLNEKYIAFRIGSFIYSKLLTVLIRVEF
jgi:hypothetical protein